MHSNRRAQNDGWAWLRGASIAMALLVILIYIGAVIKANIALSHGPYALFMDELVIYDGVKAIIRADNARDLLFQITDGGDNRYGRILWYVSAFVSFLPERLFGDQGQIIATRLANATILIGAYMLLIYTFCHGMLTRLVGFIALLSLTHTAYYTTMPKPEPIQILFLSVFLRVFVRSRASTLYHWVALGLAFGAKVSTFFLIPVFLPAYFYFWYADSQARLETNAPSLLVQQSKYRMKQWRAWIKTISIPLLGVWLGLGIAVPIVLKGRWREWVGWTFRNAGHGADDSDVSLIDWLLYLKDDYSAWHPLVVIFLSLVTIGTAIFLLYKIYVFPQLRKRVKQRANLIILLSSLCFVLAVIINVKRIWGFYLHVGLVLATVALISIFGRQLRRQLCRKKPFTKFLISTAALVLAIALLAPQFSKTLRLLNEAAARESSADHQRNLAIYQDLKILFHSEFLRNARKLRVYMDPYLYRIDTNSEYEIRQFWGYFKDWVDDFDYVVMRNFHFEIQPLSKTNKEYADAENARALLRKYVLDRSCAKSCFEVHSRNRDIVILVNRRIRRSRT